MSIRIIKVVTWLMMGMTAAGLFAAEFPPGGFQANDQWQPVNQDDLLVQQGTALDFSFLNDAPAGKHGPVIINRDGRLAFARKPKLPVRFLCNNDNMPWFQYSSDAEIEAFAEQMQRAGYNVWRPHSLDSFLMSRATEDGVPNPERFAVWDRVASAMKKRGIYLYLDLTTYGYYFNRSAWSEEGRIQRWRTRCYWDPALREMWRTGVRALLTHVNPQTGLALKDDPQVLVMQLRNEAGLIFLLHLEEKQSKLEPDPGIVAAFREWLRKQYQTTDGLRKAWTVSQGGKTICHLKAGQTIDNITLPSFWSDTPPTRDLYRFVTDAERETALWLMNVVKNEIGAKALVTDYNVGTWAAMALSRDVLPVVDNHAYHEHPSAYMEKGSHQIGSSTLATFPKPPGNYLLGLAGSRHLGGPFFVSEVGQPFWNPWRHEIGLFLPAFASLQDWQLISQFSGAVPLKATERNRHPIRCFNLGIDPPCKAAERISALLYRRGDVLASPHRIEVKLDPRNAFEKLNGWRSLPSAATQLALLAGFGVNVEAMPDAAPRASFRPSLSLNPGEGDAVAFEIGAEKTTGSAGDTPAAQQWVKTLRDRKVLSRNNRTDLSTGVFESGTGQVYWNSQGGRLEVVTPFSEGACLTAKNPKAVLPVLTAIGEGVPMTVFLGSLDHKQLDRSRRLLLIAAADAVNSGLSFSDEKHQVLDRVGSLPVLARVFKLEVSLKHQQTTSLRLWALAYNGTRAEEIPLKIKNSFAVAQIHTGHLRNGPTPYFEIAVAPKTSGAEESR